MSIHRSKQELLDKHNSIVIDRVTIAAKSILKEVMGETDALSNFKGGKNLKLFLDLTKNITSNKIREKVGI